METVQFLSLIRRTYIIDGHIICCKIGKFIFEDSYLKDHVSNIYNWRSKQCPPWLFCPLSNYFCIDFFEGRVYGWVNALAFSDLLL